jgi:tRNA modification GTPase
MRSDEDTIFALSTAPGRAAMAVLRISGPRAGEVGSILGFEMPEPRVAGLRKLRDRGDVLDQALVLFFEGPGSYSGEDVVELQIHGGRAVYDSVVSVLGRQPGFRFADPGEFSRRAVLNGRLDLTEAEAVNDLVAAETDAQRVLALQQLDGSLSGVFGGWADKLLRVRAHLEAYIDFPDEDFPGEVMTNLTAELTEIIGSMTRFLDDDRRGERLRAGLRIAVVGPPNAGKSSFVNWLTERDVAIVSSHAGTTRDIIEVHLDLAGYPVTVADTAGLRSGGDVVEAEGIRRARAWAEGADLRILVVDAAVAGDLEPAGFGFRPGDMVLLNKMDLFDRKAKISEDLEGRFRISLASGEGLDDVLGWVSRVARDRMDVSSGPVLSRSRHRDALSRCLRHVEYGLSGFAAAVEIEIVAEDLRLACDDLGRVLGRVDVEDVLDVVFRDFCIGK